jgi:diguanylate cyclase (GGDEF)-like protein/putative nucleotidyltransferase with HDIG domain
MKQLPLQAKIYVLLIIAAGVFFTLLNYSMFPPTFHQELLFFLFIAAVAGIFKISLPYFGTISIAYIFVFTTLLVYGVTESILASIVSALTASLFNVKRKNPPHRIFFNISVTALTSAGAANIFILMHGTPGQLAIPECLIPIALYTFSFYAINTFLVSAAISLSKPENILTVWKENYLWAAINYFAAGSSIALLLAYFLQSFNFFVFLLSLPLLYISYDAFKIYLSRIEEDKKHNKELADLYFSIIEALARAIDAKDKTTEKHLRRVQDIALAIGKKMGMERKELEALKAASLLHDVGKIAVPEYILSKPGKLTPEEFKKMSIHPVIGADILETVPFPYNIGPIVRYHHERFDGRGYPEGLKGHGIPLGARILTIVDCYEALTTDRPYRKALSKQEAKNFMLQEAGKQFDPEVVKIMVENLEEFDAIYENKKVSSSDQEEKGSSSAPLLSPKDKKEERNRQREQIPDLSSPPFHMEKEIFGIYETIQTLGIYLDFEELLLILTTKLRKLVHFKCCVLYLLDKKDTMLLPEFVLGDPTGKLKEMKIPLGEKLSGWALLHNTSYIGRAHVNPLMRDGTRSDLEDLSEIEEIASLKNSLVIPLLLADEQIGVLTFHDKDSNEYVTDDLNILKSLTPHLSAAIKGSMLKKRSSEHDFHDSLSGLPNTSFLFMAFENERQKQKRNLKKILLFRIEIANHEQIRSFNGYHAANRMIISVAHFLKRRIRSIDLCSRFGTDEFLLMMPSIEIQDIPDILDRLKEMWRDLNANLLTQKSDDIKIRIGYSVCPGDGEQLESLIHVAQARKENLWKAASSKEESFQSSNVLVFKRK